MQGNLFRKIDSWVGLVICGVLFLISRLHALLGGPSQPGLHDTTPPRKGDPPIRPQRILCIKTYGLGNIAMLLPVMNAIKRGIPGVEIDFLTLVENRKLLEHSGLVREVIPLTTDNARDMVGSMWNALVTVGREPYDLVLDFEQFIKMSTIYAFLSGAPHRIGFNTDGQSRGWLFTTRVVYSDNEHMSDTFMRLVRPLQIDLEKERVAFEYSEEQSANVAALLDEGEIAAKTYPVIAVHVGSGPNFYQIPLKRWPTEKFAQLCDRLVERHGAKIVLTGKGEEEAALVRETLAQMKQPAVNGCDRLTIAELLALLERCNFAISNDTSVIHLAAAVGTPVAAFFGPTNPLQYGPGGDDDLVIYKDLFCGPCLTNYNLKVSYCSDPICIRTISVDFVYEELERHYLGEDATSGRAIGNPNLRPTAKLEVLKA